jgi:hypothetical protein
VALEPRLDGRIVARDGQLLQAPRPLD